jgi:hypothetical protein
VETDSAPANADNEKKDGEMQTIGECGGSRVRAVDCSAGWGNRDDEYDLGYNAVRYCLGWSVLAYLVCVILE